MLSTGRRRYTLAKGQPDLKPGDVVRFEAPPRSRRTQAGPTPTRSGR